MDVLMRQPWPGNVRQLENTVFRGVVLAEGNYLTARDFPLLSAEFEAAGVEDGPPPPAEHEPSAAGSSIAEEESTLPITRVDQTETASHESVHVFDTEGHLRSLQEIERDLIELAIDTYGGQMTEVAQRLGMGRSTLYRKLKDHGLDVKRAS